MEKSELSVFVIMPFSQEYRDVYELGIKDACAAHGLACSRTDDQIFLHSILDRIYDQIEEADIIVSEMTGRNPNVFYETGYAHGRCKAIVLLTKNAEDIPFDLRQYPHIVYGNSIATLKSELAKRIKFLVENPKARIWKRQPSVADEPDWRLIAEHIRNYLTDKGFDSISFERIRDRINASYTDELLQNLIDKNPDEFRRSRLSGGRPGLKRLRSIGEQGLSKRQG